MQLGSRVLLMAFNNSFIGDEIVKKKLFFVSVIQRIHGD